MSNFAPEHPRSKNAPNLLAPQHGPRPLPLFLAHLLRETGNDPNLRRAALKGLRKYGTAYRSIPPHHGTTRAQCGAAKLLRHGDDKERERAPVVLIPSIINSHHVLDLGKRLSLIRYLAGLGHDPWLLDWGYPEPTDAPLNLAHHVEHRLLPLLRSIDQPPILVGYCLGGTLALAAAALLPVKAVVTIATPWHFDRYPEADRTLVANLWREAKPLCERIGYVPMEVLQSGFWALDPQRTIRKYAAFADMAEGSEAEQAFLAVEDWANEGAPLTFGAARELFEDLYAGNATGEGRWVVGGRAILPDRLTCPSLSIRSTTDRIVPAAASPDLLQCKKSDLGHVGMIVSAKAPNQIWLPLSGWLSDIGG